MRFTDEKPEIPNLWIGKGGFGRREAAGVCGTVVAPTDEVRQTMRAARTD